MSNMDHAPEKRAAGQHHSARANFILIAAYDTTYPIAIEKQIRHLSFLAG
ncbi:hypothetical protein AA0488_0286 [Kozakia baliensis NRIC 0488]|nr:hypothetical protein AA0488_0286 [Kozakia baliensis NRIC 0488]